MGCATDQEALSLVTVVTHFFKRSLSNESGGLSQKRTATSLIEKFMYPKFGPGQLWECVANDVKKRGGEVETGWTVEKLYTDGFRVTAAGAIHGENAGSGESLKRTISSQPCRLKS